jgi:phosphoribosyl-ATP pyrophosphohydrolase
MGRREDLLGIAEKMPKSAAKSAVKLSKALAGKGVLGKPQPKPATSPAVRRRIVALEGRSLRKRH